MNNNLPEEGKDSKEKDEIRSIQIQGAFLVFATCTAFLVGISVNALYEILKHSTSPWFIFIVFGSLGAIFIDILIYMIDGLEELRKNPEESFRHFLIGYVKKRLGSIRKIFNKK